MTKIWRIFVILISHIFCHISEIWGFIWSSIWGKWTNIILCSQSQRENMTLFFVIFFLNLIFFVIFFLIFSWIWTSYLIWRSYLDQMKRTLVFFALIWLISRHFLEASLDKFWTYFNSFVILLRRYSALIFITRVRFIWSKWASY